MILIEIHREPVAWMAHGGYGRKSFNPRGVEKDYYTWQIKAHYTQCIPLSGPVKVDYTYFLPIPKGVSKVRRLQMLNGMMHPIKRPDIDNFDKFLSDCLTKIVFEDDSQIVHKVSRKIYGETPKTLIKIEVLNGIS